jgi:hypothetical protein
MQGVPAGALHRGHGRWIGASTLLSLRGSNLHATPARSNSSSLGRARRPRAHTYRDRNRSNASVDRQVRSRSPRWRSAARGAAPGALPRMPGRGRERRRARLVGARSRAPARPRRLGQTDPRRAPSCSLVHADLPRKPGFAHRRARSDQSSSPSVGTVVSELSRGAASRPSG